MSSEEDTNENAELSDIDWNEDVGIVDNAVNAAGESNQSGNSKLDESKSVLANE